MGFIEDTKSTSCWSWCVTCVNLVLIHSVNCIPVSEEEAVETSWFLEHPTAVAVIFVCTLAFVSVVCIIQCGGCTDMEVGSENHPAMGGGNKSGFNEVIGDVNASVMHSSHTMPGDYNTSQDLPYSLNPSSVGVQGFTGYQPVGTQGYQGQPSAPPIRTQGYQAQAPPNLGPHAHRPAVEPPPPSYNESMSEGRGWLTRPQQ